MIRPKWEFPVDHACLVSSAQPFTKLSSSHLISPDTRVLTRPWTPSFSFQLFFMASQDTHLGIVIQPWAMIHVNMIQLLGRVTYHPAITYLLLPNYRVVRLLTTHSAFYLFISSGCFRHLPFLLHTVFLPVSTFPCLRLALFFLGPFHSNFLPAPHPLLSNEGNLLCKNKEANGS